MTAERCEAATRPTPVASFVVEPSEAAAGEPVRLLDLTYDPGAAGIAVRAWDFGDGTTSVDPQPSHRYARDGVYTVTLHVTARDGRIGVTSRDVTIATHDVALTWIAAPTRGRAGREARVVVAAQSRHRPEIAQIELFRRRGNREWRSAGTHTRPVPAHGAAEAAFLVSFDDEDAEVGHVTFEARATLVGAEDASPGDNALTAPPTLVARRRR